MTGIEDLRDELIKAGLTKASANSKAVSATIDVLTNSETKYLDLFCLEEEKKRVQSEFDCLSGEILFLKRELESLRKEKEHLSRERSQEEVALEKIKKEQGEVAEKYLEDIVKSLRECETPEMRDRMKLAQLFVDSVTVQTKYDNTAYIIGLADIIKGGLPDGIGTLRKINTKLPKPWWELK